MWRDADERLLQFRLISSKLETESQKTNEFVEQTLLDVSPKPFFAVFKEGFITDLYLEKECPKVSNLKRALVSFFQFQTKDATLTEKDVAGTCDVSYLAWSPTKFTKTRLYCKLHDLLAHKRLHHPLGISEKIKSRTDYEVGSDGILQTLESHETLSFKPNAYQNVEVVVNSTFEIDANPAVGTLETLKCQTLQECLKGLKGVEEADISSVIVPSCPDGKCYNVSVILLSYHFNQIFSARETSP